MKRIMHHGISYTCSATSNGYYRTNTSAQRNHGVDRYLHRQVWKEANGHEIPEGHHVHHEDENKDNNDPSNLKLKTKSDHLREHGQARDHSNWIRAGVEAAREWHTTEKGRAWHREHATEVAAKLQKEYHEFTCQVCGKLFITNGMGAAKNPELCSGACRQKRRRLQGKDLINAICSCCGADFKTNKLRPSANCSRSCAATSRWAKR